jgi:4-hydroxymandelate oxidase
MKPTAMDRPNPPWFPTLSELEAVAATKVPPRVWGYIAGGAGDGRTVRSNERAFRQWVIRPRVLVDVSNVDLRTRLLGQPVSAPIFVSPMAYHREVHPDGEPGVARACADESLLATYSTLSSAPMEEIARAGASAPKWFQLYLQPDFEANLRLIERAERAEFQALVITVDVPVLAVRDRQEQGGFAIDATVPIGNGPDLLPPPRAPIRSGQTFRIGEAPSPTWKTIDELRSITRLPVVLKGILSREDARLALSHGASGIVVSNHGGRQLDGAPSTLEVLPEIAREVGSSIEVYLDGGVRRAPDVLLALALGARAVGIGRPILWALAVDGERGVRRYLELLSLETASALALAGRRSVGEIDPSLCARRE